MKNRQSISHGFDMLNDDKTSKNIEVETSRSIFVPADGADRSTNEVEEVVARSDSSSGGSSLADLRKRLQHIPSPHNATRLANHAFHISRRLFQKRAIYLHGQSNPIEENTKREEKEEREALFAKRSFGDLKSKDARERRRAKLRLENAGGRAMVVSKPSEMSASNLKKDTTDEQTSDKSCLIESKTKEIFAQNPVPPLGIMLNCSPLATKQYTPLSARLPSTRSPYRNQPGDSNNDSSVCQRKGTYRSCENSPKDKVDLQPRSPVPFGDARPTRFGGYRPQTGLILQNLSSGSEAESNRDVTPNRIVCDRTTDCLIPITSRGTGISLCDTNTRDENSNDSLPSLSLSTRRSSNRSPVNSARKDHSASIIVPSTSKRDTDVAKFFASSASPRRVRYGHCFPETANTSRSDGSKSMKHISNKSVEEPMFFSAREDIRGHGREHLNTPPSLLETPARIDISPRDCKAEQPGQPRRGTLNLETNVSNSNALRGGEENSYENEKEISTNVALASPNSVSRVEGNKGTFTSTENTSRSPQIALYSPRSKGPSSGSKEFTRPSIDASAALRQTLSKCILNYGSSNDVESPRSGDSTQSRASSKEKLYVGELLKMLVDNRPSPKFIRHGKQITDNDPHKMANEEIFVNIPTLALPSQEVSCLASPISKMRSDDGRLDADTLIMALSNVSPKQETAKDVPENTCSNSCADTKTISGPGSSENNLSIDNCSEQGSSRFVDQSTSTTQGTSCRRSLSARSKIPVKIPASAGKQSAVNKSGEAGRQTFNQRRSPVKSSGQSSRRNSSSPEMTSKFGSGRSDRVSRSCETSPSIKEYPITNIEEAAEVVSDASMNVDTGEQYSYSSSKYSRNKLKGRRRTDELVRGVQSRLCFTLQSDRSSYDKSEISGRGQNLVPKVSSKSSSCDESSPNRPAIPDTSRSSKFSDNWKDQERIEKDAPPDNDNSLESNSDISSSPSSYDVQESAKESEQIKTIISNVKCMGVPFENYPGKYFNAAYEGEVYDKEVEERKSNPMKNRIGDGGCSEIQIDDSRREYHEEVSFDSSPDDEEYVRGKKIAGNRDKLRFSLEKLAAEQFRRSISSEQTKTIQSDTTAFFSERFYEIPQFSLVCSSSTSRLRHDKSRDSPRFKKKSQDRFPFTISEKTSVASVKFKVPDCRLGNLDEDEEDRGYMLDTHPSITRLAGSGFEDSPADIISYVTETEQGNRRVKSSGVKDLVKKFSARWKKSKGADDGTDADTKVTNIIYKNSDYRDECDSSMESFSESSLLKEFRLHESLGEKLCKNNGDSPDEKSTVLDKQSLDEEESSRDTPVSNVNPCRRYDRDDQWVQAFKNMDSNREEQKRDEETSNNVDESSSTRDPYSVFFVKSARETPDTSARTFRPEHDEQKQNVLTARRKNRVKFRSGSLLLTQKFSDESVGENADKRRNSERVKKNRNTQSGCLCLRFYRMIIPISFRPMSKYRSRINVNSPFIKTGSRSSARKKKG